MMLGIRLAVAEVSSSQAKIQEEEPLEQPNYELQVDYMLKAFSKLDNDAWIFKDYAPVVFHRLRQYWGISAPYYMVLD
jgi:hypothetical protein